MEPDLKDLADKALKSLENEKYKVKFFRTYARMGDALVELQELVNDYLSKTNNNIIDIKFQVQKNFLLGSTMGEFEEDAYAMVIYEE